MAKKWTATEVELLRKLYPNFQSKYVAKWIGKTMAGLAGKARDMGIRKSQAFFDDPILSGRTRGDKGKKTWFKKGLIPHNKNRKIESWMSPENVEKVKLNQFKKGQIPFNVQKVGHERITVDGYIEIKTGEFENNKDNFILKHRKVWIENNGPIPSDLMVKFKDGNSLNCEIDNLYLSSKLNNMNENFTSDKAIVKRYLNVKTAPEIERVIAEIPKLIELKRENLLLNQKIKTHVAR